MQTIKHNTTTIHKTRLQRGFLLMELLIAMIVIAFLTIGWMQWSAHQTQQKQITTTVNSINTIFSSASNCFINATSDEATSDDPDCASWSDIGTDQDGTPPFIGSSYLPENTMIPISTSTPSFSLNASCHDGSIIGDIDINGKTCDSDSATFLEITISDIPANLASAAKQVAAQLPSAIRTGGDDGDDGNNTYTLTAWMPPPASITPAGDTIIKAIKAYSSGEPVKKPTDCPDGYSAEISATPISCVGIDTSNSSISYPLQGCRIQVDDTDDSNWTVTTGLLTPNNTTEWVADDDPNNKQNYISVTTSCVKQ